MTRLYDTLNSAAQAGGVPITIAPFAAAYKAYFFDLPLTMTSETLRFAGHRLDEQARLLSKLSGCKTLSEVAEAQSDFLKDAVGEYRKEADTLVHRAKETVS